MKSVNDMTPAQIREAAHEAIIGAIGVAGLIRYLHDQSLGSGDYTRDRHFWLPDYKDPKEMFSDIEVQAKAMRAKGQLP